ncbi:MAG: hypothetical protein L3K03_07460 [Thermoplasmata archaeon]|nr:hypothetical protein [Thermoplasmata archaeon]
MPETGEGRDSAERNQGTEYSEDVGLESLRLGHDVRFLLVCVGGGATRIGSEVASRHLRYVETVAINCDPRVQEKEEFDRRVCLGYGSGPEGDAAGSPTIGSQLARAAEPALERIFQGATFVTIVASLGGGTGTGVLPFVLEAASRSAEVVSVFVVKPFTCEGERRALADRAIARLHFIDSFVEKQERNQAKLTVLDNDSMVERAPKIPLRALNREFAEVIAAHVERSFVIPAEAAFEAERLARLAEPELSPPYPEPAPPAPEREYERPMSPEPLAPSALRIDFDAMGGAPGPSLGGDAELTFEVIDPFPRGPNGG